MVPILVGFGLVSGEKITKREGFSELILYKQNGMMRQTTRTELL